MSSLKDFTFPVLIKKCQVCPENSHPIHIKLPDSTEYIRFFNSCTDCLGVCQNNNKDKHISEYLHLCKFCKKWVCTNCFSKQDNICKTCLSLDFPCHICNKDFNCLQLSPCYYCHQNVCDSDCFSSKKQGIVACTFCLKNCGTCKKYTDQTRCCHGCDIQHLCGSCTCFCLYCNSSLCVSCFENQNCLVCASDNNHDVELIKKSNSHNLIVQDRDPNEIVDVYSNIDSNENVSSSGMEVDPRTLMDNSELIYDNLNDQADQELFNLIETQT